MVGKGACYLIKLRGPGEEDYNFQISAEEGWQAEAGCRSGLPLAWAQISLSVAKCEASEKWWPNWHWGRGERKQYPGQAFAWGNILIHHPPLASFLAGDTCKLIRFLCYFARIIMLHIL